MYARHDLAWLTAEGWRHLLAATPTGTPAHAAIHRWSSAGWPLVVRRPDPTAEPVSTLGSGSKVDTGSAVVSLGLAAPPDAASGAKLRLPLSVLARHIDRTSAPLPLSSAAHALPAQWRTPFDRLCESAGQLDLRVFGSLALQALTGQPYLHGRSDIDLLFRPRSLAELDDGTQLLASHLEALPLDGEAVFPSGQAVAWKEWFTAHTASGRVLVKSSVGVKLGTRAELRAELEAA